jgi:hypothetical protein
MIEQTFSEKAIKGYSGLENALKAVEQANDRTRLELLYPEADFEPSGSEQRDDAYGKLMAALGQE